MPCHTMPVQITVNITASVPQCLPVEKSIYCETLHLGRLLNRQQHPIKGV